jgi:hypothetical protein
MFIEIIKSLTLEIAIEYFRVSLKHNELISFAINHETY